MLQRRPGNLVDLWDGVRYWRVLAIERELLLVQVRNGGSVDAPALRLTLHPRAGASPPARLRAAAVGAVRRILGLDVAADRLLGRFAAEPRLDTLMRALRGMRPPRFPDLFEAFVNVVLFQQLSIDAGSAVVGRLVRRFGETLAIAGRSYFAFPTAAALAASRSSALRACGMSRRKAATLQEVARSIEQGQLTVTALESMSSREALAYLTDIPGIGPWSAALLLLRGFGRLDVFPPGDTGAIRSLTERLQLRSPASLERIVRRYGDCQGYLYLLGIAGRLLDARLIRPA